MKKEFNLLDESWVRVLLPDYTFHSRMFSFTATNTWIWQVKQILKMLQ